MYDTLLLRSSLHCSTPLHFTQLHFTTLIATSLPLIYTSLTSYLASRIYISYRSISPHITKLDTVQFSSPNLFPKIMNRFTALKNFSAFHFTLYCILFFHLSSQPYTSLYFAIHNYKSLPFTSLPFTFYFLSPSLSLTGFHFSNPRFENMRLTLGIPYRPFR
jgi:hypothetical protein